MEQCIQSKSAGKDDKKSETEERQNSISSVIRVARRVDRG